MKKRLLIILPILILVAGFVAMRVLIGMKSEPPERVQQQRLKVVGADVVEYRNIPTSITAYGRLTSAQPIVLFSEVAGTLLQGDVPFQPAQSFKKGDLLLKIDDRQIRLDINTTKSDFLTALATVLPEIKVDFPDEYQKWQNYFDSCDFDECFQPLPQTDEQKIKLFLSRFNVYKLFYAVQNLQIRLEKHYFYAPFNGSIVSADLRVGSTARNGTRLGEIINLDHLEVEVPVQALDINWIDRSKPVTFTSSEISGEWQGSVERIGKSIDTRTQTIPVFINVNRTSGNNLYNGVFLEANIPGTDIEKAFSIPNRAIYNDKNVYC
ncbi:HlyD family efflux transporter periplasmic adaptor subunit, partial [candidate division KSB1 bacterium]|nr:HlyD family efflux transporter periplasmic adaptor subunit [candidate division KSB1 bacterium]